jgi:hypothetical protein
MPIGTALALGIGAAAGGIAGAIPKTQNSSSGINLAPESGLQNYAGNLTQQQLQSLQQGFGYGPGNQDIQNALASQRSLAGAYQQASQNGGMPTSQDVSTAQGFANDIFAAQRTQLQQQFTQQGQQYSRQLAASGRGAYDPVFSAQMYDSQQRQSQMLGSQQTGYASQLALQMPQQRLGLQAQGAQIQDALASQALQNRATLLGLGSQIQQSERNYQLATSSRWGQEQSGGGFGGFLSGAVGGATAGAGIAGGIANMNLANAWTKQMTPGGGAGSGMGFGGFSLGGPGGQGYGRGMFI